MLFEEGGSHTHTRSLAGFTYHGLCAMESQAVLGPESCFDTLGSSKLRSVLLHAWNECRRLKTWFGLCAAIRGSSR